MREHHSTLSPSSFPMLAKCPCFKAGEPGEAAQSGTRQHKYLETLLKGDAVVSFKDTIKSEVEQAEWAADFIRLHTGDNRLIEERLSLIDDEFEEITFGTLDVVCMANRAQGDKLVVMDYKSGEDHGYLPQMAVYARMAMIRFAVESCEVYELYGRRQYPKKYDLNISDTDFIFDIIAATKNPEKRPCLNEFCKWCSSQGKCPQTVGAITKVATEYEPGGEIATLPIATVKTWHASQITDPGQMSMVLTVAEYIGKWADTVKAHAKAAALKGMEIPGYILKDGNQKREFTDITEAYNASGLDADEFLACCTASVSQVEKAIARKIGFKTPTAKNARDSINSAIGGVIIRKQNTPSLVKG